MKFELGDLVYLEEDSHYKHQQNGNYGTITKIRYDNWYSVEWVDGGKDGYPEEDLIKYNKTKEYKILDNKMEILINKNIVSVVDDDGDCIEITKEQLKEIYQKVFN